MLSIDSNESVSASVKSNNNNYKKKKKKTPRVVSSSRGVFFNLLSLQLRLAGHVGAVGVNRAIVGVQREYAQNRLAALKSSSTNRLQLF